MSNTLHLSSIYNGMLYLPDNAVLELIGDELEDEVFTTLHPEHGLSIYSKEKWTDIKLNLSLSPSFSPEYRCLQRIILGHVNNMVLKKYGLIIFPLSLLSMVGFDNGTTEVCLHILNGEIEIKLK